MTKTISRLSYYCQLKNDPYSPQLTHFLVSYFVLLMDSPPGPFTLSPGDNKVKVKLKQIQD